MLMHMLIEQTEADVFVIGLIGERGREVTEFVDMLRASHKKEKCVLVLPLPISLGRSLQCGATGDNRSGIFSRPGKRVVLLSIP